MGFQDVLKNRFVQFVNKAAAVFVAFVPRDARFERRKAGDRNKQRTAGIEVHRRDNPATRTRQIGNFSLMMAIAFFAYLRDYVDVAP